MYSMYYGVAFPFYISTYLYVRSPCTCTQSVRFVRFTRCALSVLSGSLRWREWWFELARGLGIACSDHSRRGAVPKINKTHTSTRVRKSAVSEHAIFLDMRSFELKALIPRESTVLIDAKTAHNHY